MVWFGDSVDLASVAALLLFAFVGVAVVWLRLVCLIGLSWFGLAWVGFGWIRLSDMVLAWLG